MDRAEKKGQATPDILRSKNMYSGSERKNQFASSSWVSGFRSATILTDALSLASFRRTMQKSQSAR